jgi:hypothetical protein
VSLRGCAYRVSDGEAAPRVARSAPAAADAEGPSPSFAARLGRQTQHDLRHDAGAGTGVDGESGRPGSVMEKPVGVSRKCESQYGLLCVERVPLTK